MTYKIITVICTVLIVLSPAFGGISRNAIEPGTDTRLTDNIKITIVYDNYSYREGLKTEWGFAGVIERPDTTVLFDTGGDGKILLENMNKLDITPGDVDIVVLSHIHNDHIGGLDEFLEKNGDVTVHIPVSFPEDIENEIEKHGSRAVRISEPIPICKNIYSTGEMGTAVKEQSLVIDTPEGLIVITGCAHPGIVEIVKRAKQIIDKNILLVLGGFHLIRTNDEEIKSIARELKKMGVIYAAPCHCSGDNARQIFKETFEEKYLEVGLGKQLLVKNLR
jgi:7,8-dihydropterin-6-yl-methyl-4-(beta-D-ribofuranosyl)aminobenzene 5'-phosphate synthase